MTGLVACAGPILADDASQNGRFGDAVRPFLATYCGDCHGAGGEAGLNLLALEPGDFKAEATGWKRVLEAVKLGKMPPPGEPQPSEEDVAPVAAWIQLRLIQAGQESDIDHRLQQPAYANLVSHEKLFDGSIRGLSYSPPRLWRLHPQAYESFLESFGRQLGVGGPLSKPFNVSEEKGVASNYAALMQADSATLGQLLLNCKQIAQWQTFGFRKLEKDRRTKKMVERLLWNPPASFAEMIHQKEPPSSQQIAAAVGEEFQLVLGRPPSQLEAADYSRLLEQAIGIGGVRRGLRTMAMAVLLRPESIYRLEVGLGEADEHGRRMLSPYELAYALAFALTDRPPQQVLLGPQRNRRSQPPSLLDLARDGRLASRDDVRRVALEMWDNELVEKPRILRFFREFFGYHAAETVFKGERAGREFAPRHLVKDADDLVLHLVKQDRDVLRQLLTTDRYCVQWPGSKAEYERKIEYITKRIKPGNTKDRNYKYFVQRVRQGLRPMPQANPTWRATVRFYNLDENTWDYPLEQPFRMPEGQRVGMLTHPAWLAAWSGNFHNDPIRRGKWIREHLLAGSIPDLPITVDAQIPQDPHQTLRQRLQVTRQDDCWQCHRKMDPLGLPLEAYDDFGRFRTAEGLGLTKALKKPRQSLPVVTSGQILDSGDPSLDGDVEDVREMMHRLANSTRARQSFVRHAFRYWMGRNETLRDSPTLIAADNAYVERGGSFKALVVSLITSDSFLYRRDVPSRAE